ncbi:MAG: transglycosylase domain-containing protein [Pseudomonadota bacterium]
MKRILRLIGLSITILTVGLLGYGGLGYWDAVHESDNYIATAEALIASEQGPQDLGPERLKQLIMVQDPAFQEHSGIDLSTAGAGLTTVTQSLSKRLGFDSFRPGIGKVRQTGFALGLESKLSKDQILALFLKTVEMGNGPNGWMTGFFTASAAIYSRPPSRLTDNEFLRLVAVMISPAQYDLQKDDNALNKRVNRIMRLVAGTCSPAGLQDVWLDGCA